MGGYVGGHVGSHVGGHVAGHVGSNFEVKSSTYVSLVTKVLCRNAIIKCFHKTGFWQWQPYLRPFWKVKVDENVHLNAKVLYVLQK